MLLLRHNRNLRSFALAAFVASLVLAISMAPAQAQGPDTQFISIDAPGAGTHSAQGTTITAMTDLGTIGGNFTDHSYVLHGYLRAADGTFTGVNPPNSLYSQVNAINDKGQVVGNYGASDGTHAYLRYANGKFINLDVPDKDLTVPQAINAQGQVVGMTSKRGGNQSGFLWSQKTGFTVLDEPAANKNTFASAINASGVIAGYYLGSKVANFHGFIRNRSGKYTALVGPPGTSIALYGINSSGAVVGTFNDGNGSLEGYLLNADQSVAFFTVAGSDTQATDINDAGVIVGFVENEGNPLTDTFERASDGTITNNFVPFTNTQNSPSAINASGQIAGWYVDPAGVNHGWIKVQ